MHKILTVVGARPHFIKSKMVTEAIERTPCLTEVILHTGQHYDHSLSGTFFEELALPAPDYNLEIGSGGQAWQLGKMILGIDQAIQKEKPALVIVYGDTNSTAAGAVAAAKNYIPVAHIEAGLREHDKKIPEEVNKLLTDAVADLFFCPTPTGVRNLEQAGVKKGVYLVGDVGIDLIHRNQARIRSNTAVLNQYNLQKKEYFFMTCHRAANTGTPEPLRQILEAAAALNHPVVFPIHPRTRRAVADFGLDTLLSQPNFIVLNPQGFWNTQSLLHHARMAITDSGGIIKEAYFHKVPAIITDRQTEWIETIVEGWHQIAGPDQANILKCIGRFEQPAAHPAIFGDGTAAQKTVKIIEQYLTC